MTDAEPLEENRQFRGGRSAAKLPLYNVCDAQSVKCDWLFTPKEISNHRLDCSDMTTAELDLVILAKLDALVNNSTETSVNKKKDHVGGAWQRSYSHFYHNGKKYAASSFCLSIKLGMIVWMD